MKKKSAYQKALESLNKGQRQAVEAYEGVVMVLAGPGTGKTQLLATRIGYILQNTDTDPEAILCLTYTDAGTVAIRKRLLELIGPTSYRIQIHTFHSFCRRIIIQNMAVFDLDDVDTASDLDKISIVRDLLDSLPYSNPLVGTSQKYTLVGDLVHLFGEMKKEGWDDTFVLAEIESYLQSLLENPEFRYKRAGKGFKKGDLKQKVIDKITHKMNLLKEAVNLFPDYQNQLKNRGLYDYEDMLLWVHQAFEQNKELLQSVQESFLYFLVDEFQDTSGLQNKILNQMIGYWENPNIMVVGDDDQCIFEFQGATLDNLRQFKERYKDYLFSVVLNINYRSTQGLLNHAFHLIQHNQQRLVHELPVQDTPLRAFRGQGNLPLVRVYENTFQETAGIFYRIKKLLASGVEPGAIAVIYPKHALADDLIMLMEREAVPFQVKKQVNVLREESFHFIRLFFKYCEAEYKKPYSGEGILFQLLHTPFFGISYSDIRKISAFMQQTAEQEKRYFLDVLEDSQWLNQLKLQNIEKIQHFSSVIHDILKAFPVASGAKWVERVMNQSGMLDYYRRKEVSPTQLRVLHTLLDFIRNESSKQPELGASELFILFKRMEEERIPLRMYQYLNKTNSVQLLTAHGSKGLEFDHVFLMGSVDDQWEKSKGRSLAFSMPDGLISETPEEDIEENRRLFYVAVTRARNMVEISYAAYSKAGKGQTPTRFIAEMALPISQEQHPEMDTDSIQETVYSLLHSSKPQLDKVEAELLEAASNHVFTISSLEMYFQCPIRFYYTYLLKIPSLLNEQAAFGLALHKALAKALEGKTSSEKTIRPVHEVVEIFEHALRKYEYCFEKGNIGYFLNLGTSRINQYLSSFNYEEKMRVEWFLGQTEIEGVPVKGILDKVIFKDNDQVIIEDYKTSKESYSDYTRSFYPNKGKYFRQLAFYQLLLESKFGSRYKVVGTRLQYLEPDSQGKLPLKKVNIQEENLEEARQWIKNSKASLEQGHFEGCGKQDCHWCNLELQIQRQSSFESIQSDMDDFIE